MRCWPRSCLLPRQAVRGNSRPPFRSGRRGNGSLKLPLDRGHIAGISRRTGRRSLTRADTTAAPSPDRTRVVIGCSMADHHRADLVVDALDMAARTGRLEPGCAIHSDRGPEYTSSQLRAKIAELGGR
ncbi:DDE-type integrase/transposase/recombinase [Streptomyces antnestii]|uniref:DDE-type integrase/transposase/recombinase n=1 Tax=Streptomyces antnestii TaxID=2494256 RepID=UPI003D6784A6